MADIATQLYAYLWATKYAQRSAQEQAEAAERRTLDFFNGVRNVSVFQLRPISAFDLLYFDGIGSPLFEAEPRINSRPEHLAEFIWHQAVRPKSILPSKWSERRFAKFITSRFIDKKGQATGEFLHDLDVIADWINEAFIDSETAKEVDPATGAPKPTQSKPSGTLWLASIIMRIAGYTGWDEEQIMHMPLGRLWQYLREIRDRENAKQGQSAELDRAAKHGSDCLAEVNAIMRGEQPNPLKENHV